MIRNKQLLDVFTGQVHIFFYIFKWHFVFSFIWLISLRSYASPLHR